MCVHTLMDPPHMAVQKQDDQHEHTFSNYVRIQDVVLKTCLRRWTIGKSGERGSGISVLPARHDDDDDDIYLCGWQYIYIYIYIYIRVCIYICVCVCTYSLISFFYIIIYDVWVFWTYQLYISPFHFCIIQIICWEVFIYLIVYLSTL